MVDIFIGSLWLFYWNSLSSATSSSLSRSWAKAALERLTSWKTPRSPRYNMGIKPTPVALLFCVLKPQNYLRHWSYQNGVHWHKIHTDRWIPIPDWCNGEILGCNMITELPPKGPSCKMLNVLTCTYKILPIGFFWHSCISSTHDINVAVVSNCL